MNSNMHHYPLLLFLFCASWPAFAADSSSVVKELNIVHLSHTDVGFTDHPDVCRELYQRYLDIALDTALDTMRGPKERRFYWTAEGVRLPSRTGSSRPGT